MLAGLLLLLLGADDPRQPSLVTLDFKNLALPQVASAITKQTGNTVVAEFFNENQPNNPRITLSAPRPVPFWEAIDRLCAQQKLQRGIGGRAGFGVRPANLALYGPGSEPGPACYSGPFRFGGFTLKATFREEYLPPRIADPMNAVGYCAEFEVLAEPRILVVTAGPPAKLEAIDDQGRSLLDDSLTGTEKDSPRVPGYGVGASQPRIQIRLGTPRPDAKRLKRLRGVLPVELAILPKAPTATVDLAASVGQTIRSGDIALTVGEFRSKPGEPTLIRITAKVVGPRAEAATGNLPLTWARNAAIEPCLEIVDGQGRILSPGGWSSSPGEVLALSTTFGAAGAEVPPGSAPKTLRIYAPDWAAWDAPFAFGDLPLP